MSEVADVYRPSALEIAAGLLLGSDPTAGPLPRPSHLSARAELERSIQTALQRPPCIVAFPGGRDSSAMLALAASVARREQLPPPVAVTNRFPVVVEADETAWQERVIAYLGIQDWQRLEFADELDYVGPVAQDVLRRHGVMCPMNTYVPFPCSQ